MQVGQWTTGVLMTTAWHRLRGKVKKRWRVEGISEEIWMLRVQI